VVRGGPLAVSEEKNLQKLYQTLNETKINTWLTFSKKKANKFFP
jgi:hypothetical protein